MKFWDCPTPSKRNAAYVELIRTIAEFPALPISTNSVSLLEEIDPVAFTDETCNSVLLSMPPLFYKSVRVVKMFVPFTTNEPGMMTDPSLSTDSLLSAIVALDEGVLFESLLRQM